MNPTPVSSPSSSLSSSSSTSTSTSTSAVAHRPPMRSQSVQPTTREADDGYDSSENTFPKRIIDDDLIDMNASFLSDKYTLPYDSAQMPGGIEQFNQKKLYRALQLQKLLVVIEDSQITPQAAKEFLEQANSQGDGIELNQVMREEAVDALDIRIMTDDTIKHLSPAQLANWKELPILTIAELVVRYFGMRPV